MKQYVSIEGTGEKATTITAAVIDKFPYLVSSNKAVSSIFQKGTNRV